MDSEKQQLPKRLQPDPVRDAIVEIRFSANRPFEIYLGQMYATLRNAGFDYQSNQDKNSPPILPFQVGKYITAQGGGINLTVRPGSISFNISGKYPGWEVYFNIIQEILGKIFQSGIINTVERVGVRYISELDATQILSHLKTPIPNLPIEDTMTENSRMFRVELIEPPRRIMINLTEGKVGSVGVEKRSFADVDVIAPNLNSNDLKTVLLELEICHKREKEMFFHFLDDDFLQTLNPEYD